MNKVESPEASKKPKMVDVSTVTDVESKTEQALVVKETKEVNDLVLAELCLVAPLLGVNQKIKDRITLAHELKQGLNVYMPSAGTSQYLKETAAHEIANILPSLQLPKTRLDSFTGNVGEKVTCDFTGDEFKEENEVLSDKQRFYLMGKYLSEIKETEVLVNTQLLQVELT